MKRIVTCLLAALLLALTGCTGSFEPPISLDPPALEESQPASESPAPDSSDSPALTTPDSEGYAMGYLGVESAYRLLTGQAEDLAPMVDTSTQIVYRSNLFSLDSQKALFAFG